MKRRSLLGFAVAALAAPSSLLAQQRARVYRIGFLGSASPTPETVRISLDYFRLGLRERGWIEGQNIIIEQRWAEGRVERFPELAAELVRLKVDVIAAATIDAVLGARKATRTIPIVAALVRDPIQHGLVQSFARPGGNVTGLTSEAGGFPLSVKTLEFLKQAVPAAVRVAVLVNPKSAVARSQLNDLRTAGDTLKVELLPVEASTLDQLEPAFVRMRELRTDALLIPGDSMFFVHRVRVAELAIKHRLPLGSSMFEAAPAGGLLGYQVDVSDNWRRAAGYVDRILKGANPAELPVEQPNKYQLILNVRTARAIGVKLPQSLLLRADRVIE